MNTRLRGTRTLVTTSIEATWPESEPVTFLGEWCRRFVRRERWESMDARVVPFHWDDRARLASDAEYLDRRYEDLLAELTELMGEVHGLDRSARYWRILLGPWLYRAIHLVFDRWQSVEAAMDDDLSQTLVLPVEYEVPAGMGEFGAIGTSELGSHLVFARLIREQTDLPVIELKPVEGMCLYPESPVPLSQRSVKERLLRSYSYLAGSLTRQTDGLIFASFMRWRDVMDTTRRLGQVPQFWRDIPPVEAVEISTELRSRFALGRDGSAFGECLAEMIPWLLPSGYLEGFGRLRGQIADLAWPSDPKVILTSNPHGYDVFNAYAAEAVDRGTPYVVCAHSGQHGMLRWFWMEDHERRIADRYVTWGWGDEADPQVRNVGYFRARRPVGVDHASQDHLYMVLWACRQPSLQARSELLGRQWLDYFEDHVRLVELLPAAVREAMKVRLHANDRGWDQKERWRDRCPDVELDEGRGPLEDHLRSTRLYIATYLGSNNLESMVMGIPTIMFWRPEHWELRESAQHWFTELERVGVFHATPESAAAHVARVWDDVGGWWESDEVVAVVEPFVAHYCPLHEGLSRRMAGVLREAIGAGSDSSG
jgi:putative transferase (TIGR04331 family)